MYCCISFLCRCIEKPTPEIDLTLLALGWIRGPLAAHLGGLCSLCYTANLEILAQLIGTLLTQLFSPRHCKFLICVNKLATRCRNKMLAVLPAAQFCGKLNC